MKALLLGVLGLALGFSSFACTKTEDCTNGECTCEPGEACSFECTTPPCHVDCAGQNASCSGICGNSSCTCGAGSSCEFDCQSGPCHVECAGDNPSCSGVCANGTCSCEAGSSCAFSCLDNNCKFNCSGDCAVYCANGPGSQGCQIHSCGSGDPTICPDGKWTTCGQDCPAEGTEPPGGLVERDP